MLLYMATALKVFSPTDPPQMIADPEEGSLVMNPAYMAWQTQDRRVAGWVLSSMSEGTLTLVVGLRSARDIWCALETNFASRLTAKVMQYIQQLHRLKKDSLKMSEYLIKMRTYFDLLASVGISDGEQVLHVLGGLSQAYDPTVSAITSRSDPWSLGDVRSFLMSFEARMETTRGNATNIEGSQPTLNLV